MDDIDNIDTKNEFFYENAFYLTAHPSRFAKFVAHYELFKQSIDIPGHIVECGVFKGASLCRFIKFRDVFLNSFSKKVIGFDVFGKFPSCDDQEGELDERSRSNFIQEAGEKSITEERLRMFLKRCNSDENVELVKGDVSKTVPAYISKNPEIKISLLNIDVDLYEPTYDCLRYFFDRVSKGGVIILDDYNGFPGATKAIDEFFAEKPVSIKKLPWCSSPSYVIRE